MPKIRLVVFDWAGTTVDHGCFAPMTSFVEAFAQFHVEVSTEEAREPMGLPKKDQIREMLRMPTIARQWRSAHGTDSDESDVERVFEAFVPLQLEVLGRHSELIPGLLDTVKWLRDRDVRIGGTTGYFREAAEQVKRAAAEQGYAPDAARCPEDGVPAGRPAPWMIFRIMEAVGVYPAECVLKVGDTVPDIAEGRNAGAWSVGVTDSGSIIGMTAEQWQRLPDETRESLRSEAGEKLRKAGAHAVIGSVFDVPWVIDQIEAGKYV